MVRQQLLKFTASPRYYSRKNHELSVFPGPLKPGETHKNSKISSVAGRRDIMDKESYVLLWKMLVLQVQVEGSDLA